MARTARTDAQMPDKQAYQGGFHVGVLIWGPTITRMW